jgi:hypothetical protein
MGKINDFQVTNDYCCTVYTCIIFYFLNQRTTQKDGGVVCMKELYYTRIGEQKWKKEEFYP